MGAGRPDQIRMRVPAGGQGWPGRGAAGSLQASPTPNQCGGPRWSGTVWDEGLQVVCRLAMPLIRMGIAAGGWGQPGKRPRLFWSLVILVTGMLLCRIVTLQI